MRTKFFKYAALLLTALPALSSYADVTVNFTQKPSSDRLVVNRMLISDLTNGPKTRNAPVASDTIIINGLSARFPLSPSGDARYKISLADAPAATRDYVMDFYASPEENIQINVESTDPLVYSVSGTPLMDGIAEINKRLAPLEEEVRKIQTGQLPQEAIEGLSKSYDAILTDFIDSNPTSPAAIYAIISLDDEPFEKYYNNLNPALKTTLLYPFLEGDKKQRDERRILEEKRQALTSGHTTAPDFTLKNLEGKSVSLSEFKGKWVVLDFWGSWCIWCIKGFPELKKAYEQYSGKLEVIGIDCGDTHQAWTAAVKKYKLPWVNLYNPAGPSDLTQVYPVQGFPTKIIISPEGKIVDIFTGEVPQFYTRLAELIK